MFSLTVVEERIANHYVFTLLLLTIDQKKTIFGLHAFTGTNQNSSFFRKSKMRCWKIAQDYLSTFSNLRKEFEMTGNLMKELEEYVCRLHDGKSSDVNALRNEII